MQKQAPTIGRLAAMAAFTLSCFGLLLFLWLSFGGAIPLRPEGYRVEVAVPEAATLAQEADVRLAGVTIGSVKSKRLAQPDRTLVELEIDEDYAPLPRDTRAILRQKTQLGETYVELTPGSRDAPRVEDGGRLADMNVEPTVEVDEVISTFDRPTREALRDWLAELERTVRSGRSRDLNDALGNLAGFASEGADVLEVLATRERALRGLVRNTGEVFGALNEREGALSELVRNSNDVFAATASRDDALADTIAGLPAFLDESRATIERLEGFSRRTQPLVDDLRPAADDLAPTVRDVRDLAPELEDLFEDLGPLVDASERNLPALERTLKGAGPLFEGLHPFLQELNPILSFANFDRRVLSFFLVTGGATLNGGILSDPDDGKTVPVRYTRGYGIINSQGLTANGGSVPPQFTGNTYPEPNAYERALDLGAIESFTCKQTGLEGDGTRRDARDGLPPCFVKPQSLYGGTSFPRVDRGDDRRREPPRGREGTRPPQP